MFTRAELIVMLEALRFATDVYEDAADFTSEESHLTYLKEKAMVAKCLSLLDS